MPLRTKILMAVAPYLMAVGLWFGLASPTLTTSQSLNADLNSKRTKQIQLQKQLTAFQQLTKQRADLSNQIQLLKAMIPVSPDLDLLIIDIERIAEDSQVDIEAIATVDKIEKPKSEPKSEPKLNSKSDSTKKPSHPIINKLLAAKSETKNDNEIAVGVNNKLIEVTVKADYPELVTFMKHLEMYQRVISINHLNIEPPKLETTKDKPPTTALTATFIITAYYLP